MSSTKKNNYAYEIRFVDDKIVQVFDIAAKRQNESNGLPTEYLQEDVLKGQLRYSKLVGSTASPVVENTDEYQHQVTTKRSENRRSTQRHTFMMGGGGGGGGDYNRKVKSNYNNSRDHRTVAQRPSSPKSPKSSGRMSIISSTLPMSPTTNVVSPSLSASPTIEAAPPLLLASPPLQPVSPPLPPISPSIRALSPPPQPLSPSLHSLPSPFHSVSPVSQPVSPQLPPVSPLQEMSPPLISPSLMSSMSFPLHDISLSPPMSPVSPSSLQALSPPLSPNTPPPSVSPSFLPPQPARVSSSIRYDNRIVNNNSSPRAHYQYNQTINTIQMNQTSSIIPSPITAVTTPAQQHPETYYEELAMVDTSDYSSKKNFQQLDEEKKSSNNGKRACCIIQ